MPASPSCSNGGEPFNIEGRNRRPPRDPVNALLSFVYALLVKEWTLALYAAGFDPLLGFYHRPRYGRPSLALDLTEEFRPLLADSTVLTLVNNGEVTAASFIRRAGAVALTDAGRRAVIAAFERRMDTLVTHPLFGYRISYRRVLEVQARLLGRVLWARLPSIRTSAPARSAAMRNVYLVCYDVADDKRLRKTYKKMCGFRRPAAIFGVSLRIVADGEATHEGSPVGDSELGPGPRDVDRSWSGGRPGRRVHRVLGRAARGIAAPCGGDRVARHPVDGRSVGNHAERGRGELATARCRAFFSPIGFRAVRWREKPP